MRTKGKSKTAAMMAAAVLCGGVAAEAANLVVTAPGCGRPSCVGAGCGGIGQGEGLQWPVWSKKKPRWFSTGICGNNCGPRRKIRKNRGAVRAPWKKLSVRAADVMRKM